MNNCSIHYRLLNFLTVDNGLLSILNFFVSGRYEILYLFIKNDWVDIRKVFFIYKLLNLLNCFVHDLLGFFYVINSMAFLTL